MADAQSVPPEVAFTDADSHWMRQALQLARDGVNPPHPAPRAGCVLVKDERKVGEGAQSAGGAGAEVLALREAGTESAGATAYVTLGPGAYAGRDRSTVDALIGSGVVRVVVAMLDPWDSAAAQSRCARLMADGVKVQLGLLHDEAEALNPGFLQRARLGRPWVRLKLAISLDGRVAMASGESQWITGPEARRDVHRFRAQSDVVLTGVGTVLADDPSLSARAIPGLERQPTRAILDRQCRTPASAKMLGEPAPVLLFHHSGPGVAGATCVRAPLDEGGALDLEFVFKELGRRCFNEVLVECGGTLASALLRSGLVDELLVYQAPCLLGHLARPMIGLNIDLLADRLQLRTLDVTMLGDDLRIRLRPADLRN